MAAHTINLNNIQETAVTRQMDIGNRKRIENGQQALPRETWVQLFVNQQLEPLTIRAKAVMLERVVKILQDDPDKLLDIIARLDA